MLKPFLPITLLFMSVMPVVMGQDDTSTHFPNTNTGNHLKALMDCMNEPDPEKRIDFLTKGFTEKGAVAVASRQEWVSGNQEIALVAILHNKEHEIQAVFSDSNGKSIKILLSMSKEPPHAIHSVMVTPHYGEVIHSKLSSTKIVSELEAYIDQLPKKNDFSGSVLLSRGDKVLFKKAYGLASRRYGVSNNTDTKFNLGSMNKMFTAVSVLQLVQQRKLSLDERLSKYVGEEWLARDISDKIRISHLLSHTSGLGSYFNDRFAESSRARFRELDDYQPLIAEETLAFEPGSRWQYSNTGMLLLGVVIEKVSGKNYFDYVRQHVYKQANMVDTDCFDMDHPVSNLAIGYWKEDDQWKNNLFRHVIRGGPAGGGFSTVEDLHRFSLALLNFQLLDQKHTRMLVTPKPNSPAYGYGFELVKTGTGLVVGHGGGFPGVHSKLDMFVDAGFTAVVLSNADGAAKPVVEKIRELVARAK